ncbi:MAG: RING finger protein [Candidatus Merdivicinus sp.]|jgi:hypothetical protein
MFKYKGIACPHCGKEFKETDEILICPDCGAPYHRACIQELGQCKFTDLHKKGESWQPPQKAPHEEESKYDSHISMRCSRCGTVNSPDKLFCEVCGTPLNHEEAEENSGQQSSQNSQQWQNQTANPQAQFRQMAYNPYTTPFGGLDPDEEIDGIPVKDLAIYTGQNSHYFLPKFKDMSARGKKVSWNWAAFFLDSYYLFYRKLWGLGILVAVISLILSIPNSLLLYATLYAQLDLTVPFSEATLDMLYTLNNFFYILSLALKLSVAAFSNYAYKRKVFQNVEKIRAEKGNSPEYTTILTEKGGVSIKVIILCIVITLAISFASSFLMLSSLSLLQ